MQILPAIAVAKCDINLFEILLDLLEKYLMACTLYYQQNINEIGEHNIVNMNNNYIEIDKNGNYDINITNCNNSNSNSSQKMLTSFIYHRESIIIQMLVHLLSFGKLDCLLITLSIIYIYI